MFYWQRHDVRILSATDTGVAEKKCCDYVENFKETLTAFLQSDEILADLPKQEAINCTEISFWRWLLPNDLIVSFGIWKIVNYDYHHRYQQYYHHHREEWLQFFHVWHHIQVEHVEVDTPCAAFSWKKNGPLTLHCVVSRTCSRDACGFSVRHIQTLWRLTWPDACKLPSSENNTHFRLSLSSRIISSTEQANL